MTIAANEEVCVSFVHGFHDRVQVDHRARRPALWPIQDIRDVAVFDIVVNE